MEAPYHRHDISGKAWALLEPHLAGQRGRWGRIAARYAKNSDAFIAAVHVRCIAVWAAIRAWIVETISRAALPDLPSVPPRSFTNLSWTFGPDHGRIRGKYKGNCIPSCLSGCPSGEHPFDGQNWRETDAEGRMEV